jgi:hypothetical protein
MKTVRSTRFLMVALLVAIAALTVSTVGALHEEQAQPEIVLGPSVAATFEGGFPFHGAGGDEILLFGVQPSYSPDREPGILVASRSSGNEIGSVTPPPVGWRTPLSIEVYDFDRDGLSTEGSFVVLDAGVEPRWAGTRPGYIHRYRYSYSPEDGLVTT